MAHPKNISPPSYLESLANELLAKYRKLDSLISHPLAKGNYHEKILRDMIRSYLPPSFSVGEGFIINQYSETSSQLDILIVDNLDPRSFGYKENEFYIASDLAVTCFAEVKTYCTKREFIRSFHKLVEAKRLVKTEPNARISTFFFCYDAYASPKTFQKWLDDAIAEYGMKDDSKPWHFPDYVFCLKKNIMHERKSISPTQMQYYTRSSKSSGAKIMQQLILQELFQCVTNGCGRHRQVQGITLLKD